MTNYQHLSNLDSRQDHSHYLLNVSVDLCVYTTLSSWQLRSSGSTPTCVDCAVDFYHKPTNSSITTTNTTANTNSCSKWGVRHVCSVVLVNKVLILSYTEICHLFWLSVFKCPQCSKDTNVSKFVFETLKSMHYIGLN